MVVIWNPAKLKCHENIQNSFFHWNFHIAANLRITKLIFYNNSEIKMTRNIVSRLTTNLRCREILSFFLNVKKKPVKLKRPENFMSRKFLAIKYFHWNYQKMMITTGIEINLLKFARLLLGEIWRPSLAGFPHGIKILIIKNWYVLSHAFVLWISFLRTSFAFHFF